MLEYIGNKMIRLDHVSKTYKLNNVETHALQNVTIQIEEGEFVAIMGPSGCGKSTLLNIMGMLDDTSNGSYQFMDKDITTLSEKEIGRIRKQHIGFIFQSFNLIDELSVYENIELALLYQDMTSKERKYRLEEVMDQVGIGHRAKHSPGQLSGGQQQRVAIARAVVGKQKLILADEPTGNLDSIHGQEVMDMLHGLNDEGTTIVMVTHSLTHSDYARRTINLYDGQLVTENLRANGVSFGI
jgi:putative ABC transport system ATP-binding protein